jgi:predicted transcriptional regulator of viral defense system
MAGSKEEQITKRIRKMGVVRSRELEAIGVSREYLRKLVERSILRRVGRGLYSLPDFELSVDHSLAEAAKRVPQGVICLLSALRFHKLTTQSPFEVWMALPSRSWKPGGSGVSLRIVHFSEPAYNSGIEKHIIDGVPVKVYGPAKTVADCFKFRNKIGLDIALEALREGWRDRLFNMDELWKQGKICRVANVMRPYLEALSI